MLKKTLLILLLITQVTFAALSAGESNAETKQINQLLDGFHDDAANARFSEYFDRFAEAGFFLGTDATERWSVAQFKQYAQPAFEAGKGWRYRVIERNIGQSGDVAWFDEQLHNASLGRCRGTGVLIKEAGRWKIAHYSLTLLIPNNIASQVGKLSQEEMNRESN